MRALFGRGEHPVTGSPLGARFPTATAARKPVAGYDLVFSPVKSVSLLWALGENDVRRAVEQAHHAAVADVLSWLEQHAAFTRYGRGGRFQVDTYGLVAAAFDHFESRAGDPDLHTHVAVANKVRARLDRPDGSPRWWPWMARRSSRSASPHPSGTTPGSRTSCAHGCRCASSRGWTAATTARSERSPVSPSSWSTTSQPAAATSPRHWAELERVPPLHGREPSQASTTARAGGDARRPATPRRQRAAAELRRRWRDRPG